MTLLAHALSCRYHGYGGRGHLLQSRSSLFPPQSRTFQPASSSPLGSYPRTSGVFASSQVIWNQVDIREKQVRQGASTVSNGFSMQSAGRLPIRILITILVITVVSPAFLCGCAHAAEALKASSLGLKVASFLRGTGWPDEAIVFLMAMLPVLELRGAIPVGYWMQLDPFKLSVLSVLGNMVPVPFIILYMEKLATFLSDRSSTAKKIVNRLFESTRRKAEPIQEFEWLGLMLFVAVPFPGTGAWTGAMAASVLGMPFWDAMSANFFGVVMAGLLVNLLLNLGVKYAVLVGIALFLVSTFMWSFLRVLLKNKK